MVIILELRQKSQNFEMFLVQILRGERVLIFFYYG